MAPLFAFGPAELLAALALALALGAAALHWLLTRNHQFWKKRNVPYVQPIPFFGNIKESVLLRKNIMFVMEELYYQLEGHAYGGVFQFHHPTLLLRDPEVIKTFMLKDFSHFQDRGFRGETGNPLSEHLFILGGPKWRNLRAKLTPTFTSGKMKMMFHIIEECSKQLQQCLAEPASNGEIVELKEVLAKFTTDVIGTCAFGLQMNALDNPDSEFRKMGRKVFNVSNSTGIKRLLAIFLPKLDKWLKIKRVDPSLTKFFVNVVKETVEYREKNEIKRNDFLQLLIDLKNKAKLEEAEKTTHPEARNGQHKETAEDTLEFSDGFMAAQAFVFFAAGFETSSSAMSFALHELALQPELQATLREEVDATLKENGGRFTYDAVMGMKYMDKVVSETLRKYPALGVLNRIVTIPYTIPDTNVTLEKELKVVIPLYALHHDPKYFPDPHRFDPERFSEEQKAKRPHYVYMPFGEGPRICIGMRFGLLQTKMGLAALLAKYEFHVCERTEVKQRIDPRGFVTTSVSGTVLRITARR